MTSDELTGCPAEEHVRFAVAMLSVGAEKAALEDMRRHFDLSDDEAQFLASRFARWAQGVPGIEAVRGWRQAVDGALVVECRSSGGRDSELRLDLSPSGRLGHARIQPALDGVDITAHRTSELTADQRGGVFDVFDAAYREADHSYLAAQLDSLQSIGVAWRGDSVVGFSITGNEQADLPIVGGRP